MKKIGIISGKGGTGKTTVAYSFADALSKRGFKAALLDVDLTGPNITDILENQELQVRNDKFIPSCEENLKYISLGQIVSDGDPVLWKGSDIKSAAEQLLQRTEWGELDYLVIDFPPGTGQEAQALLPMIDSVVIVTVPSVLSQSNVARIIEMCRETQTPILGLVKNMTHFKCSECGTIHKIFPEDHDFTTLGIPTLATIPLDPTVAREKIMNSFPVQKILDAMIHPVLLRPKKRSLKRKMIEVLLKFRYGRE